LKAIRLNEPLFSSHVGGGLTLGFASSVLQAIGLAMMKSRGLVLPPAQGFTAPRVVLRWIKDPVWLAGFALQVVGFVLEFVAFADAPISLVTVMSQGGIAAFVVLAVVFLRERANLREAAGIAGTVLAMVLLGLSLQSGVVESGMNSTALAVFSAGSILFTATPWSKAGTGTMGIAAAIASGIAFGLASLYTKALADIFATHSGFAMVMQIAISPWLYLMIVANLAGLVLLQNSFHWARGIIAMPLSSAISNVVPILGGMVAFGEGLPADRSAAALRVAAFILTIVAGFALVKDEPAVTVKT
jgi:drug/metabolite transporter (DMT)-like permease